MIATRLGTKWKFSGYTYREEMVSDALENCVVAVHNFDPEKSKNPFAYFTQIIYYAFLRRIEKEKKQTFVKYKSLEHFLVDASLNDEDAEAYSTFDITNDKMKPILEKYEKKHKTKKAQQKQNEGIEKFIEGE
jgi:DNA-directed RNA polymerase specialized sigma24 family protein